VTTDQRKKSLQRIPATAFLCGERHESGDRHTLIRVVVNPDSARTPDPAPFPDEACASEKVRLDDHAVEAPHVLRWVLTAEPGLIRKDVELHEVTICRVSLLEKNEM
jgi:hypothetical protein